MFELCMQIKRVIEDWTQTHLLFNFNFKAYNVIDVEALFSF